MSLLRPSIAGKMLRVGNSSLRRVVPGTQRFDTHTALGTTLTTSDKAEATAAGSAVTTTEESKKPRHNQPDYAAEVDQATS